VSSRPLLRALSRSPSLSRWSIVGPLQVIAVFLALMGFMVVKNKGKAKAFVKSFMSFEGPAVLFNRSFQGTFPISRVRRVMCRHYCPGALPRNMGADRRHHSWFVMLTSVDSYQDIVGDAFFVLGMNKHAEKDWVSDLLMP
jgi:hypothetical protein